MSIIVVTAPTRTLLVWLFLATLSLVGCGDDESRERAPTALPVGVVARIEISPRGALLTPGASSQTFEARAFDAENRQVEASFTWSSNGADTVSVSAAGGHAATATAQKPLGSALITAETGGLRTSVFAVAAEPVAGAVLLRDEQIIGLPTAVDGAAQFGPGYRYKVEVSPSVKAPVGAVVLSTGGKTVAGRVISAESTSITVEQIALDEVLPRVDIRQKLDLTEGVSGDPALTPRSAGPRGLRPLAEKEFTIGGLECKVEGSLGALEFTKKDFAISPLKGLTYDLVWNDNEKNIVVSGEPSVTFELEAVVKGQLEGKVNCKATLKEFVIPLPGVLGIFLGAVVPVGIGFEVGAKAIVTQAGVNFKGGAKAKLSFGFRCLAGACNAVTDAESSGSLTPKWIPPQQFDLLSTTFEPEADVFAWAKLEGGARFSSTLRFDAIEAQAGFKLGGSFASEESQAKQPTYSSSYKLVFAVAVGPAGAAETFLKLVKIAVALVQFKKEFPIGDSPVGVGLTASPENFKTGDAVDFALSLDPKKVAFPVVGYNVESVRIYRKDVRPDGSVSLVLANEVLPQGEQVDFKIPWVATIDGAVEDKFVAFVKTKLLDLRLEAATSASFALSGELTTPAGVKYPATDGYTYIDTDSGSAGTVTQSGVIFFSQVSQGLLACSTKQVKASTDYYRLEFLRDKALAAGTYTLNGAPLTLRAQYRKVGPTCATELFSFSMFDSGTLTLTQVSTAGVVGTFSLVNAAGTTTGKFSVPTCVKTYAEHQGLAFACTP